MSWPHVDRGGGGEEGRREREEGMKVERHFETC
jgi:hypothetical protein